MCVVGRREPSIAVAWLLQLHPPSPALQGSPSGQALRVSGPAVPHLWTVPLGSLTLPVWVKEALS